MSINFEDANVKKYMFDGNFGLEKESLRVDSSGFLSLTGHPFSNDKNIDRDFCESQTEIITDACPTAQALYDEILSLHSRVSQTILKLDTGAEYLWPFSNPAYIKDESSIPIASYSGTLRGKEMYRKYLAQKYGKKKMLFSGIHFNFSFSDELLSAAHKADGKKAFSEFKDEIYLELAKKITMYGWLIVYLTAASPVLDGSFLSDSSQGKDIVSKYASVRCGKAGYWNDFIPLLEYKSLSAYAKSIQEYVDSGQLISPSELYYPVRLKPTGDNSLEALTANGINHIELRMLDLNPLSSCGIAKEDIFFLHLLIIYLISLEDSDFEIPQQMSAIKNLQNAALLDETKIIIETPSGEKRPVSALIYDILCDMERFFSAYGTPYSSEVIALQKEKAANPDKRYAAIIAKRFGTDYVKNGLKLAMEYTGGENNV